MDVWKHIDNSNSDATLGPPETAAIPYSHTSYSPTARPSAAAPMAIPMPAVTCAPPPELPALPLAPAWATCSPYPVVVITVPLIVLVTTLVAVVLCVQLDHEDHGAFVFHGPAVQPGQSEGGHALLPHQAVQGPLRQSERVDQSEKGP